MSSYFDSFGTEQRRIREMPDGIARQDAHRAHELKLVFDVTVCVEWPGCPEEIRDRAYAAVLKHGVQSQPQSMGFGAYNERVNEDEDEWREVGMMASNLHDIFHDLASMGIRPFTDNPLAPVRDLSYNGDERRLLLAKKAAGYIDPPADPDL